MSEFNGKKYYGFSLHNDPALLTTTRNFEFRYTLPENLDRVIQKVQLSDAAESKNKKNLLAKYCKLKKQAARQTPYHTRDVDVETHMSRNDLLKVRNLSEQEIDQLIGKAKSTVNMVSGRGRADELDQPQKQKRTDGDPTNRTTTDDRPEKIVFEDCRLPQPKWVEIEENSGHVVVSLGDPKQPRLMTKPMEETASLPIECLEHTVMQQQQEIKKLQEKQEMHTEIKRLLQSQTHATIGIHPTPLLAASEMEPPDYYVEDSDYEYEMLKRPDYAKYCEQRPTVDEMTNVSNDSGGGVAKFIEIEPHIPCMDLSFLKNAKPIRYTDLTDELPEEERLNNCQMMDYIKGMKEFNSIQKMENEPQPTDKKASKKEAMDKKELAKRKIFPYKPILTSQAPRTSQLSPRKSIKNLSIASAQNSPKSNKSKSPRNPNSDRAKSVKPKNLVLTKSLEELKMEKVALFSKMNGTQERIIEMLDKLRMNLLEASVPENNYEKNRRQKNTMEFSVRFSRNFLYPLRGMIDYLHNTTPEHFNSSSSNEACTRVAAIYALMLQSLQTYQRQLRFFMLSQVPQKLSALIEVVQSTTKLCLEKGVFDMNDPIIECLLDRCSKFVGFLADLHNQRFTAARDNYRKTHDKKSSVHDKYDLKMFMNDLNMYEPKLVPKLRQSNMRIPRKGALTITTSSSNTTARRRPRRTRKDSNIQLNPPAFSSEMALTKAAEDAIATQIQSLDSSDILSSVQNLTKLSQEMMQDKDVPEGLNPLNKAVIEALQLVTKQQVRQVLEPIIQTLGTALDKKNNAETIEAILKALNRKTFSTTEEENRKRCDPRNNRKRSKVLDVKTDSTSSILNTSTSFKVRKNTKKLTQSRSTPHSSSKNSRTDTKKYDERDESDDGGDDFNVGVGTANDSDDFESNEEWESVIEDELETEKQSKVRGNTAPRQQQQQPRQRRQQTEEREELMRRQEARLQELLELRQQLQRKKEQEQQRAHSRKNLKQQPHGEDHPQQRNQHKLHREDHQQQQQSKQQQQQQQKQHQRHPEEYHSERQQKQHRHQQQQDHEQRQQQQQQQEHHQQQKQQQHLKQHNQKQQQQHKQQQQQQQHQPLQQPQQQKQQRRNPDPQQKLLLQIPLQQHMQHKMQKQQPLPRSKSVAPQQQQQQLQQNPPTTTTRHSSSHSNSKRSSNSAACSTITTPRTTTAMSTPKASNEAEQQRQHQQQQQTRPLRHAPPCVPKARSLRLLKKRRNLLKSPPPVPNGTPLTSARSRFGKLATLRSTAEVAETHEVDVQELPRATTHLNTSFNGEYFNCTENSAVQSMTSHRIDKTPIEAGQILKPAEADVAVSAIAAALNKINVTDGSNAPNLMQNDVIKDFLTKCLFGAKSSAANEEEDDDDNDDNDDDDEDEDDDDDEEDNESFNEYDVNGAVGGSDCCEIASYVSTSRINKKKSQQQKEQERNTKDLDSLGQQQKPLQKEPLTQSELHVQQLREQQQDHPQIETNPSQQPTNKEPLLIEQQQQQEISTEQRRQQCLQDEPYYQRDTQQTYQQDTQHEHDYQQRPPLNEINQANVRNRSTKDDNSLSELFFNGTDGNNNSSKGPKVDLKVENMLNARDQFLGMCNKNRFYTNPTYSDPWKVFSCLSDKLATDIVNSVEVDFGVGVTKFVEDFLELETHN